MIKFAKLLVRIGMLELDYFKNLLLEKKKKIEKNIKEQILELEDLRNVDINDDADLISLATNSLIDSAISNSQLKELKEIDKALKRIENGTYGICEMCGEPIKRLRLKVKPHAKYCIVCREIAERESKI